MSPGYVLLSYVSLTGHDESWGELAGVISVALHMIANGRNTKGLFHGAFMESGAVIPVGDMSLSQQDYNNLAQVARCAGAKDTLECLQQVPLSMLTEAMNSSLSLFSYWVCYCHDPVSFLLQIPQVINKIHDLMTISFLSYLITHIPYHSLILSKAR